MARASARSRAPVIVMSAPKSAPRSNSSRKWKAQLAEARSKSSKALAATKEKLAGKGAIVETTALFVTGVAASGVIGGLGWDNIFGLDPRLIVGAVGLGVALFGVKSPVMARRIAALSAGIMAPTVAGYLEDIIAGVVS